MMGFAMRRETPVSGYARQAFKSHRASQMFFTFLKIFPYLYEINRKFFQNIPEIPIFLPLNHIEIFPYFDYNN